MRTTYTYVCGAGHLVKAENSTVNIDSLCARCKSQAQLRARGLRSAAELAASRPHGDRLLYMAGCRCDECRRANTAYETKRRKARNSGDWNGIVPAARARAHMRKLSRLGVGRHAVQAATDVAGGVLAAIVDGSKRHIRARTERKILAVTEAMASDRALTSVRKTWKLLTRLFAPRNPARQRARDGAQCGTRRAPASRADELERCLREPDSTTGLIPPAFTPSR